MNRPLVTFDLFSALIDSRTGASRVLDVMAAEWISFAEHYARALAATCDDLGLAGSPREDAAALLESVGDRPLRPDVADGLPALARRHRAGVLSDVDDDELVRLFDAMKGTLTDALDRQQGQKAATMKGEKRSGLMVHARTGLPCPVCGDNVREVSFADTSLQYCPTCQTGGKPLADRRMSKLLR